jgi:hypothetical protein
VHTSGGKATLQPLGIASPAPGYGTANNAATAAGDATARARFRSPDAQAATSCVDASLAEACGEFGAKFVVGVEPTVVGEAGARGRWRVVTVAAAVVAGVAGELSEPAPPRPAAHPAAGAARRGTNAIRATMRAGPDVTTAFWPAGAPLSGQAGAHITKVIV